MNPELLKAIDPYVRKVGLYTSYTLDQAEFVGVVRCAIPGIHWYLPKHAYEPSPTMFGISLEAAKKHPKTGEVNDWSYRKVDPENPRYQYHIHGWEHYEDGPTKAYDEIATHRELRPDFQILEGESLRDAKDRLQTHYRPEWGTSEYQQGKMCEKLEKIVTSES